MPKKKAIEKVIEKIKEKSEVENDVEIIETEDNDINEEEDDDGYDIDNVDKNAIVEEDEKEGDKEEEEKKTEIYEEDEEKKEEVEEDTKCLYSFVKKRRPKDEEDLVDDETEIKFDDDDKKFNEIVSSNERITKRKLCKYERVRILAVRARQLASGAKPMIKNVDKMSSIDIAKLELKNKVIPFIIERVLPNGKKEQWKVSELV